MSRYDFELINAINLYVPDRDIYNYTLKFAFIYRTKDHEIVE